MGLDDLMWNLWHGCHKYSEECQNCFAFYLDKKYNRDTNKVVKNKSNFNAPLKKDRQGNINLKKDLLLEYV